MIEQLTSYLHQHAPLSEEERAFVHENVPVKTFKAGTVLLEEGAVSRAFYFVLSGCVRLYYLASDEERTAFFYTENQFVSSYQSYTRQTPSSHYISCVSDCTLAIIGQDTAMALLSRFPTFEVLARIIMEEELSTYQEVMATYIALTPEQRYLRMQEHNPELLQRIPQYHLATYLGVKPESLSRIRRRIAERSAS